jgi:alkaline phosphatase
MDYGYMVTSPLTDRCELNGDAQTCRLDDDRIGGFNPKFGGTTPWSQAAVTEYLIGTYRGQLDVVTDSASSATSMCSGVKTYNAAINVDISGQQLVPIARRLQAERQFAVGLVTSVPISHATPAAGYANNVSRDDYQDLTRDLIGVRSVAHRTEPLPGVDVLIGCGWGEEKDAESRQGTNYVPGNRYLTAEDLRSIDVAHGGRYSVAVRTEGKNGAELLAQAAASAAANKTRLLGFFGTSHGHLPYQTADGNYDPTRGHKSMEKYSPGDLSENPTLAQMTAAALRVLQENPNGFWLMVEAGDVDWANHDDNIDNSIGAVFSGDEAVKTITDWIEAHHAWTESAVIITADHGHYFHLVDPQALVATDANGGEVKTVQK